MSSLPPVFILEIFLGFMGCGLSLMFCIMFCRTCSRLRAEEIEREVWRRSEHDGRPQSIYFIPFPRGLPQEDSESQHGGGGGENVDEHHTPPRYSITVSRGLPPSYNEVFQQGLKPDDSPPAYTEHNLPLSTPAHMDTVQSRAQSQP